MKFRITLLIKYKILNTPQISESLFLNKDRQQIAVAPAFRGAFCHAHAPTRTHVPTDWPTDRPDIRRVGSPRDDVTEGSDLGLTSPSSPPSSLQGIIRRPAVDRIGLPTFRRARSSVDFTDRVVVVDRSPIDLSLLITESLRTLPYPFRRLYKFAFLYVTFEPYSRHRNWEIYVHRPVWIRTRSTVLRTSRNALGDYYFILIYTIFNRLARTNDV